MKKLKKILTTQKNDQVIIDICRLLYPEYRMHMMGGDIMYVYDSDKKPIEMIHWYELVKNNMLPDLSLKLDGITDSMHDDENEDIPDEFKDRLLSSYDDIQEMQFEGRFEENLPFMDLQQILENIKEYEQIIADKRAIGQNNVNGAEVIS